MKFSISRILSKTKDPEVPYATIQAENEDLQMEIWRENLRQAKTSFDLYQLSFKVAITVTFASTVTTLIGSTLLFAGKVSEGTLTTGISAISGTCFYQISKEAKDRAEKANKKLNEASKELMSRG